MTTSMPFRDGKPKIDLTKHPLWWQRSVRGVGVGVIGFGLWRLAEAFLMWKDETVKQRDSME